MKACPLSEACALARAFVFFGFFGEVPPVTYFAYLDEFGHIGPYVSKQHPKHNDSPVFGLAGFVLPFGRGREFGTWFFQRKCQLLSFEIRQSGEHPAQWEKKSSSLYTVRNVRAYRDSDISRTACSGKSKPSVASFPMSVSRRPSLQKTPIRKDFTILSFVKPSSGLPNSVKATAILRKILS